MAKSKNESHTGFRNGDLFCFNCGASYHIVYPQPARFAADIMIAFDKSHNNCSKTWSEAVPQPEGKSVEENELWWLENGEQGISSKTMFRHLSQPGNRSLLKNHNGDSHPHDPDDFSRCYKLLIAIPQFKSQLWIMKTLTPEWAILIDNWEKLTEMYEAKDNGMYEFMQSILKPI